jgi:hypothetical protein
MRLTETADTAIPALAPLQRRLFQAGAVGAALSVVGLIVDARQFFQSYLLAYMTCLGMTLGCLALGMVHQLSGGAWGVLIRRPIGAASRVLPVMTLLFLPVAAGMRHLYPWTQAEIVAADEVLQQKQAYLNTPFFLARASIYFLAWNAISYFLNAWGREQDLTGRPELARKMQRLSAAGLVVYGLTVTFAAFDWLMSLEPHWYSTIYGVLLMGGQGLSSMAFLILVIVWLGRRPPLNRVVVPAHLHDLGNLLLAFVMLWAYFSFSQYLIIWSGNLPHEIGWYVHRVETSWALVGAGLVLFHFAVPFVLLLSRAVKRHAAGIVKVAALIVIVRVVDLWWQIAPEFHRDGITVSWLDVVLPLSMGALWLGCFVAQLRRRPILPIHDPQFEEAVGPLLERPDEGRRSTAH